MDQTENYPGDDNGIEECEHCSGKKEGEYNSEESEAEDSAGEGGCEICQKATDEEKMLLCDYCDLAFHMYCLNPPLNAIPEEDWFCNECKDALAKKEKRAQAKANGKRKKEEQVKLEENAQEGKIPKTEEATTVNGDEQTANS